MNPWTLIAGMRHVIGMTSIGPAVETMFIKKSAIKKEEQTMKTLIIALTILVGVFSFTLPMQGWAQAVETVQKDLAKAEWYQELANLGRLVIEHYKDERQAYGTIPSLVDPTRSTGPSAEETDKHYDALIDEGESHLAELEAVAAQYRLQAKKLGGA